MPRWPLLLLPPAVSTSTSLAWFLVVHRRRFTIAPSLAVELPSWSRRPLSSRRALHHPQFTIAPSIAAHRHCALSPSPLRLRHPSPTRSRRAVPRHQGAVVPSIAVAVKEPSHHPSPSRSRCAIPRRRGAITSSISVAVKEPLHRPSPSRSHCTVHCCRGVVVPFLTIKEPLAVSTDDSGHSSRPSQASCPDGCHVASPHAAAFHLPAPLIVALPFLPLVHPAGCHVSSLLTPPPPICWRLRLSWRRRLLSRPSQASRPAG